MRLEYFSSVVNSVFTCTFVNQKINCLAKFLGLSVHYILSINQNNYHKLTIAQDHGSIKFRH